MGEWDPLQTGVLDLAQKVQSQLGDALAALSAADLALADSVVRGDEAINRRRYDIEDAVTASLLEGGYDSGQLRALLAVLHIAGELERIADHAEGIAKVALMLGKAPARRISPALLDLGGMVVKMLGDGIAAFATHDAGAARNLCATDDLVDQRYDAVNSELLSSMTEDRESVMVNTYLSWVAHNLERIADRVTNICERTVYSVEGRIDELNTSNY